MSAPQRSQPGFLYPKPTGKYDHPWYKPLPKGRARAYDLLYMSATTLLAVAAGYTFFETGRGSYYIIQASRARGKEAAAAAGSESQ